MPQTAGMLRLSGESINDLSAMVRSPDDGFFSTDDDTPDRRCKLGFKLHKGAIALLEPV